MVAKGSYTGGQYLMIATNGKKTVRIEQVDGLYHIQRNGLEEVAVLTRKEALVMAMDHLL
jgi:hypothetical protein